MITLSADQLKAIMPNAQDVTEWAKALTDAMQLFGIDTPARAAMFLAQVAHESGELHYTEENLNYSSDALRRTWPKRFPDAALASRYARNPERIANMVYANRMGNGPESTGDGWKYRGRGPIQITGKDNYKALSEASGVDLVKEPDHITKCKLNMALSAAWFFAIRSGCMQPADAKDLVACTKRINGGLTGLEDRRKFYERACKVLKV